jgi:hypothetical protein
MSIAITFMILSLILVISIGLVLFGLCGLGVISIVKLIDWVKEKDGR